MNNFACTDSIDTRTCLEQVRELVSAGNAYMNSPTAAGAKADLLKQIAQYITNLFRTFGLIGETADNEAIGFDSAAGNSTAASDILLPALGALADFRDAVRSIARDLRATELLSLCDRLRDDVLPEMGIRLEDRGAGGDGAPQSVIKFVDRAVLLRERDERRRAEEERRAEKERKRLEGLRIEAEREAQRRVHPGELFHIGEFAGKFSAFDLESGVPTHGMDGSELPKGQRKKLAKRLEQQQKRYAEWLSTQGQGDGAQEAASQAD